MLKIIVLLTSALSVYGYFTLPGKCPEVAETENFNLNDVGNLFRLVKKEIQTFNKGSPYF
jgi:hypothetical protein